MFSFICWAFVEIPSHVLFHWFQFCGLQWLSNSSIHHDGARACRCSIFIPREKEESLMAPSRFCRHLHNCFLFPQGRQEWGKIQECIGQNGPEVSHIYSRVIGICCYRNLHGLGCKNNKNTHVRSGWCQKIWDEYLWSACLPKLWSGFRDYFLPPIQLLGWPSLIRWMPDSQMIWEGMTGMELVTASFCCLWKYVLL